MIDDHALTPPLLRVSGIAAILSGILFFTGVGLQFASGWFPEDALAAGDMDVWLETISAGRPLALLGIGGSILAIMLWTLVGLVLYRLHAPAHPISALIGWAGFLGGVPLALVAFAFAFGATWGMMNVASSTDTTLSTSLMRGFLVMDDLATFLIGGVGAGGFSVAALRSGRLPRWTAYIGLAAAVLVTVVLLRYLMPAFGFAVIGYPVVLVWFIASGAALVGLSRRRAAPPLTTT